MTTVVLVVELVAAVGAPIALMVLGSVAVGRRFK